MERHGTEPFQKRCLYIWPGVCIGESMHTAGFGMIFYLFI